MREPDWFDGTEQDGAGGDRHPRRRLLLALAAIPWLLVVVILVAPLRGEPAGDPGADRDDGQGEGPATDQDDRERAAPADGTADGAHDPSHTGTPPQGEPVGAAADGSTGDGADGDGTPPPSPDGDGPGEEDTGSTVLALEELRGRWRVAPGEEELASLAVVLARAHLTGIGPPLAVAGAAPSATTYAEHLVVEAVEHPSPATAVVTVLAVVLVDPSPEPGRVELRRLAIPLTSDTAPPALAGAPWELPAPPLPEPASVDLEPVDDPSLLAAADTALAIAGPGEQRTTALATAPGWPLVATTTDAEGEERSLWLRRHLDGLVVAGSTLTGTQDPEEQP